MSGYFLFGSDRSGDASANGFDASSGTHASTVFRRTATRADILEAVNDSCPGLSRTEARDILEMALDEMSAALARGEAVKLRSFGLFSVREKRERVGRNPRTGVEAPIKPRRVLTFKPSPVLLNRVNGRESSKAEDE